MTCWRTPQGDEHRPRPGGGRPRSGPVHARGARTAPSAPTTGGGFRTQAVHRGHLRSARPGRPGPTACASARLLRDPSHACHPSTDPSSLSEMSRRNCQDLSVIEIGEIWRWTHEFTTSCYRGRNTAMRFKFHARQRCHTRHTCVPSPTDPTLRPHPRRNAPGVIPVAIPVLMAVAGSPYLDLSAARSWLSLSHRWALRRRAWHPALAHLGAARDGRLGQPLHLCRRHGLCRRAGRHHRTPPAGHRCARLSRSSSTQYCRRSLPNLCLRAIRSCRRGKPLSRP